MTAPEPPKGGELPEITGKLETQLLHAVLPPSPIAAAFRGAQFALATLATESQEVERWLLRVYLAWEKDSFDDGPQFGEIIDDIDRFLGGSVEERRTRLVALTQERTESVDRFPSGDRTFQDPETGYWEAIPEPALSQPPASSSGEEITLADDAQAVLGALDMNRDTFPPAESAAYVIRAQAARLATAESERDALLDGFADCYQRFGHLWDKYDIDGEDAEPVLNRLSRPLDFYPETPLEGQEQESEIEAELLRRATLGFMSTRDRRAMQLGASIALATRPKVAELDGEIERLRVFCDVCGGELAEPGTLVFGPPNMDSGVKKSHVCIGCTPKLNAVLALNQERTESGDIYRVLKYHEDFIFPPDPSQPPDSNSGEEGRLCSECSYATVHDDGGCMVCHLRETINDRTARLATAESEREEAKREAFLEAADLTGRALKSGVNQNHPAAKTALHLLQKRFLALATPIHEETEAQGAGASRELWQWLEVNPDATALQVAEFVNGLVALATPNDEASGKFRDMADLAVSRLKPHSFGARKAIVLLREAAERADQPSLNRGELERLTRELLRLLLDDPIRTDAHRGPHKYRSWDIDEMPVGPCLLCELLPQIRALLTPTTPGKGE